MVELEDITNMESMVRDMELNGLQLSWLQKMLSDVRERKNLVELIAFRRAKAQKAKQEAQEAEQQLAELKKKRRFA
ncbi:hypothetical protein V6N13_109886 [Hibiscus sabdariffa]|uniref:Uncharacterized protein n=1 Tax=Hibiscus sabdariffa TaxID=183260 RepID=A0ABR2FQY8_9ROSI